MKRFSLSLQHLVLRWILLVFDAIDDTAPLHTVYNIIMYYIQVDDLVRRMSDTLVSVPDPNQPQHHFQYILQAMYALGERTGNETSILLDDINTYLHYIIN